MEAIRTTMNSARLAPIIDLPDALRNREVEVIVLSSPTVLGVEEPDEESSVDSFMQRYLHIFFWHC